jgi:hypothetical protein
MSLSYTSLTAKPVPAGVIRDVNINGIAKKLTVALPASQVKSVVHFPQRRTMNMSAPSNAFSGTSQPFVVTIKRGDLNKLGHIKARIGLQIAGGNAVTCPTTHLFDRITVSTASDNKQICINYPDAMLTNLLCRYSKGRQRSLFADLNIDGSEDGFMGAGPNRAPGIYYFLLPLYFNGFFENFDLWLGESKADLNFTFTPAQNVVVSGAGTVSLSSLQFVIENDRLSATDVQEYTTLYNSYSCECNFLEPHIIRESRTLTAGTVNYIDMTPVNGLASHHTIMVRAIGSSNVGNTSMRYYNLGDNEGAAIDLVDSSQQSMYGAGSAVPTRYIRSSTTDSMDSDWMLNSPVYMLSYADNFSKSLSGIIDGAYRFVGAKDQIALVLPPAGVSEVQSILPAAAIASGNYRFMFQGQLSAELAYNATPAQMAAAFAAIKTAACRFLTCVFSQALSTGGAVTCTFTHPQTSGLSGDLLQIVGNGIASCATTITTPGTAGIATGQYDVAVYTYLYKRASYNSGTLRSNNI